MPCPVLSIPHSSPPQPCYSRLGSATLRDLRVSLSPGLRNPRCSQDLPSPLLPPLGPGPDQAQVLPIPRPCGPRRRRAGAADPASAARSAPARPAPYPVRRPLRSERLRTAPDCTGSRGRRSGGTPPRCAQERAAPGEGTKAQGARRGAGAGRRGRGARGLWKRLRPETHTARGRFPGARGPAAAPTSPDSQHTRAILRWSAECLLSNEGEVVGGRRVQT